MFIGWMFRNRWLALGFVALICWQATQVADTADKMTSAAKVADQPSTLSDMSGDAPPMR